VLTVGHDARPRVWSFPDDQPPTSIVLELPQPAAEADANGNAAVNPPPIRPDFDQLGGAFSWDGRYVAIGGRDVNTGESIGWIWNLAPEPGKAPTLHATIRGHGLGGINSLFFLPGDDRLLTAGADGTCRMWDWHKGQIPDDPNEPFAADFLITLVRPGEATTHRGAVTSVRATRDGRIVTASADGTVLIWPK
jgi:WD40 repeat protein